MSAEEVSQVSNREERAFVWGLVLPLGILTVALKIWRVVERAEMGAWWSALELLRSDILMILGFTALGYGVLRLVPSAALRVGLLGGLQGLAILWAALEVVAHQFYMVTGSTFDLHLLVFSLGRMEETFSVVASEVPGVYWTFLAVVVALLMLGPWVVRALVKQGEASRGSGPALAMGAGFICVVLASLPAVGENYAAFGRSNALNMAFSLRDVGAVEMAAMQRRSLRDLAVVEKEEGVRKNLAVVILESTRARSMSVYQPDLETTPFLASLAEESLVADRAYAVVPHTSKALVAILCGIEPRLRMPITEAQPGAIPARCLADLLGDVGYRSIFMQSATQRFEDRPQLVENMGYDDFMALEDMEAHRFEKANYFGREDAVMLDPSRRWIEENHRQAPFFATYLTLTPHHDYLAPRRRFGRVDYVEDDELNRYLNTIHYVDQFARELVEQYRELGVYEDTVFVFVGDHGEGFNEHGRSQHDNVIWEEGIHVPLLIYDPSRPQGQRISHPVSQLDLVPSLLAWLGLEIDGADHPGRLIWESDEDRRVYAHCWYERRCMAVVGERWKVIDHFGRRGPEVYDLVEDPLETQNLADQREEGLRQAQAELFGWREAVNGLYRGESKDRVAESVLDELPESAQKLDFQLGEYVRFRGYELHQSEARLGRPFRVTYYFEALQPIPVGWQLFVHGEGLGRMLNLDHAPVHGLHPLDEWEVGTIVADQHTIRIPQNREPGTLKIYLGIYHRDQGRLPIDGEVDTDDERRAKVLEVPVLQ